MGHFMFVLKTLCAWLLILMLAMLNGAFREALLLPNLSRAAAFLLSGLSLSALIVIVAVGLARWMELKTASRCMLAGGLWFSLTLLFEFGFGGLMQGKSWAEMLEAYTFKDGNLWPVVLMVTLFAPLVGARIRLRWRGQS